jgi:hypothetical protein
VKNIYVVSVNDAFVVEYICISECIYSTTLFARLGKKNLLHRVQVGVFVHFYYRVISSSHRDVAQASFSLRMMMQ